MTPVPDEMLMAYADGELSAVEAKALETRLAREPALRARLEPFVETRRRLALEFGPTLHEPVPRHLVEAIARGAPGRRQHSTSFGIGERARAWLSTVGEALAPRQMPFSTAASVAALMVLSAGAGWFAGHSNPTASAPRPVATGIVMTSGPSLLASGAFAHALEATPSKSLTNDATSDVSIIPTLSFRTADGNVCREYRIATSSETGFAGVACKRGDGQWVLPLHVETVGGKPTADGGPYSSAAGPGVAAVNTFIDTTIAGLAFGPEEEAEALRKNWR